MWVFAELPKIAHYVTAKGKIDAKRFTKRTQWRGRQMGPRIPAQKQVVRIRGETAETSGAVIGGATLLCALCVGPLCWRGRVARPEWTGSDTPLALSPAAPWRLSWARASTARRRISLPALLGAGVKEQRRAIARCKSNNLLGAQLIRWS